MKLETKSRITVFFLSFLVWILITMKFSLESLIAGLLLSFVTSIFAGEILIVTERKFHLNRIFYSIKYIVKLFWEMLKANFHVAYIVIHPKLPVKPGIVKIKTKLKRDSALTMLANSITLTPGTLTIDVDKENQFLYIHWIDVLTEDTEEATKKIGGKFEKILEEIFE
ncbi:MAG: Na+/H+ antiporter subunit E [Candidatus Cloacimonadota bacterium]|nr:Na+/H+ antiporter subunit E [Candidatus Cloacimonadota bacterium]